MPVELHARIASIQARFAPETTGGQLGASTNSTDFASTMASMNQAQSDALFGAGANGTNPLNALLGTEGMTGAAGLAGLGGANGLTANQQQLISSAMASRNAALGVSGVGGIGSAGAYQQLNGSSRIASKATVVNIESGLKSSGKNGKLADSELTSIGVGSHKLHAEAANGYKQMVAAAKAEGIDIGITDSYRSYEGQVDVARRKGLYSEGGLAAKPGTSDHGWGLAVDLKLDSKAQSWMRANAGRFGFVEDTPREPWHWKFDGV